MSVTNTDDDAHRAETPARGADQPDPPAPATFEEFWPYYVSQHLDPTCRRLHFVGTSLALACVAAAPFAPTALLAAPVFGYGFAWVGHFAFEKNRPASWNSPKHFAWSLRGDLRMWGRMLRGTMDAEVARVQLADDVAQSAA